MIQWVSSKFIWNRWTEAALKCAIPALLALMPVHGMAQGAAWGEARAQVVALAQADNIVAIESVVQSAQEAFERNQTDEQRIAGILDGVSDKRLPFYDIETQLNQWVTQSPQSYAARLLRGKFLGKAAEHARGSAWARLTKEAQFARMRELQKRSREDLLAAAELTRIPLHARVRLLWNALVGGEREFFQEQYALAVAHSPGSMRLRRVAMAAREPRWGGTYEAMAAYASESASAMTPAYATELKAAVASDEANMFLSAGKYDAAEKKLSAAIRLSNASIHHAERADALVRGGRAQESVEELKIAFGDPNYYRADAADALAMLGRQHGQLEGVGELIDKALAHHPDQAELLNVRGFRLQESGNQARAYVDYRAAAETGDTWAETMVGKYLFSGWGGVTVNREEALIWLRRAAAKGDRDAQVSITQGLEMMNRRSEINAAQDEFQKINQREADEKAANAARAQQGDALPNTWLRIVLLWHRYYLYFALLVLVLGAIMIAWDRRTK